LLFRYGQRQLRDIHDNTKLAVTTVAEVKADVDTMTGNHLAHIQKGIEASVHKVTDRLNCWLSSQTVRHEIEHREPNIYLT
jgi:hypothetical protein